MLRTVLSWVTDRLGGENAESQATDDESDGEDEEGGFLPSRLDASVLTAHGMGTGQAEREIEDIEEHAELLEEHHREK
jgi:hypothetical protein